MYIYFDPVILFMDVSHRGIHTHVPNEVSTSIFTTNGLQKQKEGSKLKVRQ